MNLLKHRSMRFYLVFFLILTMAIGGSAIAAFADSGTGATVSVSQGGLTEAGPDSGVSAAPVILNGTDQTTSYSLGLKVIDARGTAAGWHLTITSTLFDDGAGHQLASDASSINATPLVACNVNPIHCTNPTNGVTYPPLIVPAASPAPSAIPLFNAAPGSGMGNFTITPTVNVSIPANTIAGNYSTTVSVAVSTGP